MGMNGLEVDRMICGKWKLEQEAVSAVLAEMDDGCLPQSAFEAKVV